MDRLEFLKMAQKVTVYTNNFKNLSKPVFSGHTVSYNGIEYYPQSVQVGYDESGNVENVATLHDLKRNAVVFVKLERVARCEP